MVLHYGERVVIDFSLDSLDKDNPPLFGYITNVMVDEKLNPGTLVHKTYYKALGDDGNEYMMVDMVYGPPLLHSFMNKMHVLQLLYDRNQDLQKEVEVLQEYQKVYVDAITRRLIRGQSAEDLKARFEKFAKEVLNEAEQDHELVSYFYDNMMSEFDKSQY
ncbi:MAG: hypothetical protein MJ246_04095 [Clostridia bacterium]|nr:hypothetical protein [Clostridia bacterium]